MKLGSLFDGSGGFPLAGALAGIEPVWAAEIEPYPIAVTRSRFPRMRHLGGVSDVNGRKIEPVDVITFGSPCQDLSIAGKRAGIHEGERSNLFFEAIRIIREMREATDGRYPTFAVWENVPGAFSSNGGDDFRCVLEALASVAGRGVSVPRPAGGKWLRAGEIMGDGFSIAWRQLDAQYWGVPQRRKRIYLVADFAGRRAGKILFERESLRGSAAQGGAPGEGTAADATGSAGGSCAAGGVIYVMQGNCIDRADSARCNGMGWRQNACYTLDVIDRPAICFKPGQGVKARTIGASEATAPTLASEAGGNAVPGICYPNIFHTLTAHNAWNPESEQTPNCVCYPQIARTLTAEADASSCIDRGQNVVCYDVRGNGDGANVHTLTGDHENRVTDYTAVCVMAHGQSNAEIMQNLCPTLNCNHEQPIAVYGGKPTRKYSVRRLTPLECCRLQGFPDGWGVPDHKDRLTDEELRFWQGVRDTSATIAGKQPKKYSAEAMTKWYNALHTDSAEYKMWGNGIALPCAAFVLAGMAEQWGGM